MEKPTIFFSHSSKDRDLILPIKNKLIDITSGTMDIFMSSDGQSIPFGRNWVSKIEEGLKNAQMMFIFVTPNSIKSDWIYFEAGYAYSKEIQVIPVGIGINIEELKAPLNLLQGFNILACDSMNNFISVINKKFSVSYKEDFDELDYSLICKELYKEKLNIESLDIIGSCECEYTFISKSDSTTDFYNKLISYMKDKNIEYSFSENMLLINGIKIQWYSSSRETDTTWKKCMKFQLSSINIRESFVLLIDIMRDLEQSSLSLNVELGNKFYCTYKDENISSIISGIDTLSLNPNKVGTFQYKDIEWKVINNYCLDREIEITITFEVDKVDFDAIIDLLDCLYQVGIIRKIDDEQLYL